MTGTVADLQRALRQAAAEPDTEPVADSGLAVPAWGARAVGLPPGPATLAPIGPASRRIAPSVRGTAEANPVGEPLRARRPRRRSWPVPAAGPVVAVAALCGGAGTSSVCVGIADVWAAVGRRVAVLDASGPAGGMSPLPEPVGVWPEGRGGAGRAAGLIAGALRSGPIAVIGGPKVPEPPLLSAVVGDARQSAAVVIDLPSRHEHLAAAVAAVGADLVVMCCPARPGALRATAGFLRSLPDRAGWPPVVLAITGRSARGARPAAGAASDVTAGWVRLTTKTPGTSVRRLGLAADVAATHSQKGTGQ